MGYYVEFCNWQNSMKRNNKIEKCSYTITSCTCSSIIILLICVFLGVWNSLDKKCCQNQGCNSLRFPEDILFLLDTTLGSRAGYVPGDFVPIGVLSLNDRCLNPTILQERSMCSFRVAYEV